MIPKLDQKLIKNTIKLGAMYGIDEVTTSKLAKKTHIAEGTIFLHFKTKKDLLCQAFLSIDSELAELVNSFYNGKPLTKDQFKEIWLIFVKFLLSNPDKALYYNYFRKSLLHTEDIMEKQKSIHVVYTSVTGKIQESCNLNNIPYYRMCLIFVLDTSLNFIEHFIKGKLEVTEENIDILFDLISEKPFALLNIN